ncbi:porin [Salinicola acroporae]|uniref:Porin n=1 Tax=Salinicola acroporae TaxID=1541440 RepID=A0ABT6I421_9GAMM|nr:porin [Salinicola acroporae]MDH4572371.1 porin [Salinicola acroporae]
MKKTLLATAIAGALGASAAAQAATVYNQDGTQLDIYGNIQIAYSNVNDENGDGRDQVEDNGSTIGFSGQHIINPGLTGYFKAEFEHNADEEKANGGINRGDQAYLGLKGNFGDARLGSWDPLIDDWVQDPISNNEYFDVSDSSGAALSPIADNVIYGTSDREGDKFQYMSPVWAGFQFAVGTQYKGDAEELADNYNQDSNASFYGGVKYAVGAFSIAAVYDDLDNYDGRYDGQDGAYYESGDQYGVTAQYTIDTLRLAAKVERFDSEQGDADANFYALGARYGYALSDSFAGDIYGAYQYIDVDDGSTFLNGDDSANEIVGGVTYNISPAMYTFIEGALRDRSQDEGDGIAVGAVYSF